MNEPPVKLEQLLKKLYSYIVSLLTVTVGAGVTVTVQVVLFGVQPPKV